MSAPLSLSKTDLIASVVERLQLLGGQVPDDEAVFWRELATHLGLVPKSKDASRVAQSVLSHLNEDWDDDFADDDGSLSLSLYETLDDALRRAEEAGDRKEESEEEDQDDEGLAGITSDLHISPLTYGLQTVFEWIKSGVLVLSPEWQRNFVWKSKKQKRLIESILLGLPIPSFLIFEDSSDGKKYVIDGRQRLETIARFKAQKEKKGEARLRFRTFGKKEPGWGASEPLAEAAGKYYDQLAQKFKTRFDSAPLVMAEFRDIPLSRLYQVFKRYNTGAVALNAAEIRNAVYQASPLHAMLFRVAGELRPSPGYINAEEERVSVDLRETMQNKKQRYGAYDFIGRYFAFAYAERGSVAKATLDFMESFGEEGGSRIEEFRKEFIQVFKTAASWYADGFLIDPDEGRFHAFLATLQLVSTKFMLEHIDSSRASEASVRECVSKNWGALARNRLARKQNSTLFWGSQKTWVSILESTLGVPLRYEGWDWKTDLEAKDEEAAV